MPGKISQQTFLFLGFSIKKNLIFNEILLIMGGGGNTGSFQPEAVSMVMALKQ
jgi:hypothetical protein